MRSLLPLALALPLAARAGGAALDLPVPSPCAQRWDEDSDGRTDTVTHYVYDTDRFLALLVVDDGADGRPESIVRFAHDAEGHPTAATHDDDADGRIDRRTDCTRGYCTTNWVPQCPAYAECTRNALGLVETMRFRGATVRNDYSCWQRDAQGLWRYEAPADLPSLSAQPR